VVAEEGLEVGGCVGGDKVACDVGDGYVSETWGGGREKWLLRGRCVGVRGEGYSYHPMPMFGLAGLPPRRGEVVIASFRRRDSG